MAKNKNRHPAPPTPTRPTSANVGSVWGWLALGWAAFVTYRYSVVFPYFSQLPPIPPLDQVPTDLKVFVRDGYALFLLVTSILGMSAFGSILLRLFKLNWASSLEEKVFSMGFGMATWGYLLLGLGAVHAYRPGVFWGLWIAGLGLAWWRYFRGRALTALNNAASELNGWGQRQTGWGVHKILLGVMLVIACVMAFVPEVFYDAMVYHLGVPRWFLHEGGIGYYPAFHAQFPFLRQMLNLWGLALEGERLAKLLHVSSAPLLIATYAVLAQRYSYPRTALIAPLAFLSMPMVHMNLWTSGVDAGISSFALLAFLAWMNGLQEPALRARWFSLAGCFSGFCFASKYPGLLIIAGLCIATFFAIAVGEKDLLGALRETVRLGSVASLVMLPWLIKTWLLTGNPVYPYLFSVFGGRDLQPDRIIDFTSDTGTGAKHALLPLLQTPWTATFSEMTSFTAPGTFFLGLGVFWIIGFFRTETRKTWYIAGGLFFTLYWFCINMMTDRMRLGIPGIAIGCFLWAHAVGWFYERGGSLFRFALATVVALGTALGLTSSLPVIYYSYNPWNVLAGRESARDYLSYTHSGMNPYPATAIFEAIREHMRPGERLLIVGDEKTSACPVPFIASGVHNDSPLVQWSRAAKTPDDIAQRFRENKVAYMLLNVQEIVRLYPYKVLTWDDRSLGLYNDFFNKHLRLVHQDQIVERLANQRTPLLLYKFFDTPPTTPPSPNVLSEIDREKRRPPPHAS